MKKIISVILALFILISAFIINFNVNAESQLTFGIETVDVITPGSVIDVPITIKNNPGISVVGLTLYFSSDLTFINPDDEYDGYDPIILSEKVGKKTRTFDISLGNIGSGEQNILFVSNSTYDITSDGFLGVFKFKVSDNAVVGDTVSISVFVKSNGKPISASEIVFPYNLEEPQTFTVSCLNHVWDNGTVIPHLCDVEGEKLYKCKNAGCTATKTELLPPTEHIFTEEIVNPTTKSKGYTLHQCINCEYSYKDNYTNPVTNGFVNEDGIIKYYVNKVFQTKWQTIDGNKYYFKLKTGEMVTGITKISEKYYVFGDDGILVGGLNGFVTDENGKTKYYINGVVQSGWFDINGKTYYFSKATNNMITGIKEIGGKLYVFNDDGTLEYALTDFVTDENGKTKYYKDGAMQTGWVDINGDTYYFSIKTGNMISGLRIIGEKAYTFTDDGKLIGKYTGYYTEYGVTKYYKDGVHLTKWQTIDGIKCYFKIKDGEMLKGWQTVGGKQYYFKLATGEMVTGTVTISGKAHSFGSDGVYIGTYTGFLNTDGVTKYFKDGVMQTKWQTINGYQYYFKISTGEMLTGDNTVGGKLYHFASDGKLIG